MKMPAISIYQILNGHLVLSVIIVDTRTIVEAENHIRDVVPDANMMKVRHQERCSTSVSFRSILPFIFVSR
jgi:hypothetical protein